MAKSGKRKPHNRKNETTKWIVRGVVGLGFIILVTLAFLDRSVKTHATTTTRTWLDELQIATEEEKDLLYSELAQHISGQPQTTGDASNGQVVYSWNGIFRSYKTTITCEDDDRPVVVRIEGPGS